MPSFDTYIYNNDGSILYADDGYSDFGFTALITENGFNITGGIGSIGNTYEGATFENNTLTLPFKIKGFSKTPNQSNPDEGFAVGDTADFGTVLNVANNYYAVNSPVAQKKPDWANCFVKTASGNKAVEKVWIKQNGQLVTVWDGGGGGGAVDFATDSWETISAACKDGSYKTVYKVGDTKDIELSTGETITVAIMGFDHDDLSDGSGKAPITLGMTELMATTYRMNSTDTNAGGWDESEMRTSTMATLLTQLPSDLQSVIKQVNKKATAGSQSTTITTSADKLFLFALAELASKTGLENSTSASIKNNAATYEQEGTQYEYFKNTVGDADIYKACPALVKKLSNGGGSANNWWLRSPSLGGSTYFWYVTPSGDVIRSGASISHGVSFGFCV